MALQKYTVEYLSKVIRPEDDMEAIQQKLGNLSYSRILELCAEMIRLYKDREMPAQKITKKIRITQEQLDEFFIVRETDTVPFSPNGAYYNQDAKLKTHSGDDTPKKRRGRPRKTTENNDNVGLLNIPE